MLPTLPPMAFKEDAMKRFVRVEYDRAYCGGDYKGTGEFALLPLSQCRGENGIERAFEQQTGLSEMRIIHYSPDELYTEDGKLIES